MKRYIAEIAGRDSVAAILQFAQENNNVEIIPTIALTGTEYGDLSSYNKNLDFLKCKLEKAHVTFPKVIYLQNGDLWNYINARYQYCIYKKFLFYTPCICCHLYAHLLRVPIYKEFEANGIITGERIYHSGTVKANQHDKTITIFDEIFQKNGMVFVRPLLEINNNKKIEQIIGDGNIIQHANDVKCVMSGNLTGFSLEKRNQIFLMEKYLEEYVLAVGNFCVNELLDRGAVDINKLKRLIEGILDV